MYIYIYIYIYTYIYIYSFKDSFAAFAHAEDQASWRLQDVVLLRGLCARINCLLLSPPPPACPTLVHCYCMTIARQYTTSLRPPLCILYTMQYWS